MPNQLFINYFITQLYYSIEAGPPREALQGGTALGSQDRLRLLSKLRIWVENTPQKCLWGPSEIHGPFHGSWGPGQMYRLNPTSHRPRREAESNQPMQSPVWTFTIFLSCHRIWTSFKRSPVLKDHFFFIANVTS